MKKIIKRLFNRKFLMLVLLVNLILPINATSSTNSTKVSGTVTGSGTISFSKTTATAGTAINYTVSPDLGWRIKNIYYTYDTYDNGEVTKTVTLDASKLTGTFNIPNASGYTTITSTNCTTCSGGSCWPSVCTGWVTLYTSNVNFYVELEAMFVNYTVNHYVEELDGTFKLKQTEVKSEIMNETVNSSQIAKTFTGFSLFKFLE